MREETRTHVDQLGSDPQHAPSKAGRVRLRSYLWSFLLLTQPHTTMMKTMCFDNAHLKSLLSRFCIAVLPET